ncbi:MAG: hypothetical protein ACREEM_45000 [Blastocatellia bacterium]
MADGAFSVHRLVQAVIRDGLAPAESKPWAEAALRVIHKAFPSGNIQTDMASWTVCARLLLHATQAAEFAEGQGVAPAETAELLNCIGSYFYHAIAGYAEARRSFEPPPAPILHTRAGF